MNGSFFGVILSLLPYHWVPSCFQSLSYIFQASSPLLSMLSYQNAKHKSNLLSIAISIKPQFVFCLNHLLIFLFLQSRHFFLSRSSIKIYAAAAPEFHWLFVLCLSLVCHFSGVLVPWNQSKLRDTRTLSEWLWKSILSGSLYKLFIKLFRSSECYKRSFKN